MVHLLLSMLVRNY